MGETQLLNPMQADFDASGWQARGSASGFLAPVPAVMVRQKLQVFEQFCPVFEKQNFYRIGVTGPEAMENPPSGEEFNAMNPSFVGQENSTCCCRFWCGNMREFKMLISQALGPDAPGDPLMRLERPFQFSICCCCVMICPQELSVFSNDGKHIGTVVQDWDCGRCWEASCCPGGYIYYAVKGAAGDTQFYLRPKYPTICNGCVNLCAPTCCNKTFEVDVLDADGRTVLSKMHNIFPGINCRCIADASNLLLQFPPKASPEQKSLLLGALFLVEYIHFEKQKQNSDI